MRFVNGDEVDSHAAMVMPEILLPLCSPGYNDQAARQAADGGDTLIHLSDGERDWYDRFPSFRQNGRHPANTLTFSDYAIVLQAALLGQGIALGWLNVACRWMLSGALVPAEQDVSVTRRTCQLLHPADKPIRSAVSDIRDWIIAETRSDVAAVDQLYPALQLKQLMRTVE